jgi:CoA:oxalate CoA-transferase
VRRPAWLTDARFADPDSRRANAAAMHAELDAVFGSRDAGEWEAELNRAGIPCGVVRDIGEAVALPGLEERGLRLPLTVPGLPDQEQIAVLGAGVHAPSAAPGHLEPPPRLGEHTAEVLEWLDRTES